VSARKLKGIGMKTIGVIFPHEISAINSSSYFGQILDGITDAATTSRYNAMLFTGLSWYQAESDYSAYVDGRCDGHILIAPSTTPKLVGELLHHGVPVVLVGATSHEEGVASYTSSNRAASEQAIAHLAALGHTRIAHVAGNPQSSEAQERQAGYLAGMESHGLPVLREYIYLGDFHRLGGAAAFDYWMKLPDGVRPTAAVCANDHMAAGIMDSAASHGLSIPHDFSVIGFDDIESTQPPLTTFRQQLRELGRLATECLIHQLEGREAKVEVVRLDAPMVERETCAPAPKSIPQGHSAEIKGDQ
jgi:DNA-binding LacI/PurR family transcriptional regulator